jgi:hypothetical protein
MTQAFWIPKTPISGAEMPEVAYTGMCGIPNQGITPEKSSN